MVTSYGSDYRMIGVRFQAWAGHRVQLLLQWVPGVSFPGCKAAGARRADHSPPSSAKVKQRVEHSPLHLPAMVLS